MIDQLIGRGDLEGLERLTGTEAKTCYIKSMVCEKRGNFEQALSWAEKAIECSESEDDLAWSRITMCYALWRLGRFDQALELAHKLPSSEARCKMLNIKGLILWSRGRKGSSEDLELAARTHLEALECWGADLGRSYSLNNLGNTLISLGRLDDAKKYIQQALAIREQLQMDELVATSLRDMGRLLEQMGNYEEACRYHKDSLAIRGRIGNPLAVAKSLGSLGLCMLRMGKKGADLVAEANQLFVSVGREDYANMLNKSTKQLLSRREQRRSETA